tara:strand:- start:2494 stop:2721 length:228 start_codon:yes stop_codon:yes gene_type:complete
MKFRGTLETNDGNVEVFEFEGITKDQAKAEMRERIQGKLVDVAFARLFEIHRSDVDLICRWSVDSNLVITEKFMI